MTHHDLRGPFTSVMACPCRSLFLLSSCGSLCSDPFHTQRIFVLGTAISNVRLLPKPPHTSHLYPHNPTYTTHPHIIQYTPGTRRYSLASTLYPTVSPSHHSITYRPDLCSILCSRSFRSFCPNFTFPCSRLCLSFLSSLAFVDIFDLCSPFLSRSFLPPPRHCSAG